MLLMYPTFTYARTHALAMTSGHRGHKTVVVRLSSLFPLSVRVTDNNQVHVPLSRFPQQALQVPSVHQVLLVQLVLAAR